MNGDDLQAHAEYLAAMAHKGSNLTDASLSRFPSRASVAAVASHALASRWTSAFVARPVVAMTGAEVIREMVLYGASAAHSESDIVDPANFEITDAVMTRAWDSAMEHIRTLGLDPETVAQKAADIVRAWEDAPDEEVQLVTLERDAEE